MHANVSQGILPIKLSGNRVVLEAFFTSQSKLKAMKGKSMEVVVNNFVI